MKFLYFCYDEIFQPYHALLSEKGYLPGIVIDMRYSNPILNSRRCCNLKNNNAAREFLMPVSSAKLFLLPHWQVYPQSVLQYNNTKLSHTWHQTRNIYFNFCTMVYKIRVTDRYGTKFLLLKCAASVTLPGLPLCTVQHS